VFYTCNIYHWRNVIHQSNYYNKTPSEGMGPVVVAHHSIAAGRQPQRLGPWCRSLPLWGSCSSTYAADPDPCMVHHCCPLDWLSVSVWCRSSSPAGSSVVVMVLALFASSLVSYCSPSPFTVVTPSPIPVVCRSPPPCLVICFLSVIALPSILRAGAHSGGTRWGAAFDI
jgi:hypothetical protein